jgi:hypothetical protein
LHKKLYLSALLGACMEGVRAPCEVSASTRGLARMELHLRQRLLPIKWADAGPSSSGWFREASPRSLQDRRLWHKVFPFVPPSHESEANNPATWTELPEHLLESIFERVQKDGDADWTGRAVRESLPCLPLYAWAVPRICYMACFKGCCCDCA